MVNIFRSLLVLIAFFAMVLAPLTTFAVKRNKEFRAHFLSKHIATKANAPTGADAERVASQKPRSFGLGPRPAGKTCNVYRKGDPENSIGTFLELKPGEMSFVRTFQQPDSDKISATRLSCRFEQPVRNFPSGLGTDSMKRIKELVSEDLESPSEKVFVKCGDHSDMIPREKYDLLSFSEITRYPFSAKESCDGLEMNGQKISKVCMENGIEKGQERLSIFTNVSNVHALTQTGREIQFPSHCSKDSKPEETMYAGAQQICFTEPNEVAEFLKSDRFKAILNKEGQEKYKQRPVTLVQGMVAMASQSVGSGFSCVHSSPSPQSVANIFLKQQLMENSPQAIRDIIDNNPQ